jgi:hypothetical protein
VLILQYKVGLISGFPVAQACGSEWAFAPVPAAAANQTLTQPSAVGTCQPGAITFAPLQGSATSQDFLGVLFGDCTGNWQPSSGGGAALSVAPAAPARLHLGRAHRLHGRWRVALYVESAQPFHGLDVELRYDSTRLVAVGARPAPATRPASLAVNTHTAGRVTAALASVAAISGGRTPLLVFEFRALTSSASNAAVHIVRASLDDQPTN